MRKLFAVSVCAMLIAGIASSAGADVIFSDDFSNSGNLNGMSADVGGSWSVSGSYTVSGGVVDSADNSSGSPDLAFASFTQALAAGETLTFTFQTVNTSGSFATDGWAGVSLYEGGSERVFMGSPGMTASWGIAGVMGGRTFSPTITGEAQTAIFEYVYDSGAWSFTVAGRTLSGTTTSGLALDRVRIGSDMSNIADIAVTDMTASIVPEPTTMGLVIAGGLAVLARRKRKA